MSFSARAKRWLRGCWVLALAAVWLSAQSTKPSVSPVELFHRVSARLMDDVRRMPRYTCTQNITRRFYWSDLRGPHSCSVILQKRSERKRALQLGSTDHLELEVALADRREVHSWPDATSAVDDDEILDLVGNGALGSGDFAGFVGAIFGGSAKVIYEGEIVVNEKSLLQYSFQIPKSASRYQVDTAAGPIVTAYQGSFLLDPQAEDLVHFTARTAELPVATPSCQAISEIEYGRSEIHGIPVLIPREADLRLIRTTGDEAVTSTSYSSCREFASKSRLLLDPGSAEGKEEAKSEPIAQLRSTAFPPGIKFTCRILTEIDSEVPAGRPVEGVLRSPIRDKSGTVLAPTGARVKGRIVRLVRHFSAYDYFELAVRLESVELSGGDRPIYAVLIDQPPGPVPPKAQVGYDPSDYPQAMTSPTGLLANTGEFFFVQEHMRMKNLDAEWMTTPPQEKKGVKIETQVAENQSRSAPVVNPATPAVSAAVPVAQQAANAENALPQAAANEPVVNTLPQNDALKQPNTLPASDQQPPDFRLRVESNLVLVRVVVRDNQGSPIRNLKKEDFELFDKAKHQDIAQFELVSSSTEPVAPAAKSSGQPSPHAVSSPAHPSFLVLYFDDLNTSDADMMDARDAAERYLGNGLPTNERVAIFTSNGPLTDFTADPKQIQAGLEKLHTSPRSIRRGHDCPELTDFQAQQITEFQDAYTIDAWRIAIDDVEARCNPAPPPIPEVAALAIKYNLIRMQARRVLDQAQVLARSNLQRLEQVVDYLLQFPGQRTVVLVSPGFLSESEQAQLDRIIDQALREQVVVSALDPKGLALLMRETDITRSYIPAANSGVVGATHNVDFMREAGATDVMMELADGTGGKFFHNNNDLQAGFRTVSGSPDYYILAFVPGEFDGKFHQLEVKLTQTKGSVQARRGYFAVKNAVETEEAQSAAAPPGPKSAVKDDLQRMMSSRQEIHDLTIVVSTEVVPSSEQTKDLNVMVRLDVASVPFRKEGDRNFNTVTFVTGIYDDDGKWVNGEKKQFDLKLPDSELKDMQASGVGVRNTFKLKPGKYLLREVVQDTEDHHIAALNRTVEVR